MGKWVRRTVPEIKNIFLAILLENSLNHQKQMVKKIRCLTRSTFARQDAPFLGQGCIPSAMACPTGRHMQPKSGSHRESCKLGEGRWRTLRLHKGMLFQHSHYTNSTLWPTCNPQRSTARPCLMKISSCPLLFISTSGSPVAPSP